MEKPARSQRATLGIVFLTVCLDLVGFGIVLPLLPRFAAQHQASETLIGLLMATYSLMQFFFSPLWGRLSDRIGRRPVLLISICGSAASYLLFAFAPNLPMLFASRALAGIMAANISTAQACIADITAPEDRARGMGMIGAAFALGFVFGPALGGVLGSGSNPQVMIGLVAAGFSLLDLVLAAAVLPETLTEEMRARAVAPRGGRLERMAASLRHPSLGLPIIIFFLCTVAWSQLEPTITRLVQLKHHFGPMETGLMFAFLGVVVALIQGGYTGRAARKIGEARLVLVGTLLLGIGLLLVPLARGVAEVFAVLLLLGVGQSLNTPGLQSLISRAAAAEDQGSTLGVSQGFSSLARVVGPAMGGWLFGRDLAYPFWLGAALMVLAFVLASRLKAPAAPAQA